MLMPIIEEGLVAMTGLFWDLGDPASIKPVMA
jgi:hypothetical protein